MCGLLSQRTLTVYAVAITRSWFYHHLVARISGKALRTWRGLRRGLMVPLEVFGR